MTEKYIQTFDGLKLRTRLYPTENPKGTLFWVHGFAEHLGRYTQIIEYFLAKGFASLIYDQRGHGKSQGARGYVSSFDEFLRDMDTVYENYKQELPGDIFLIGHSMGGLNVIRYIEQEKLKIPVKKTIASAPMLGLAIKVPAWKETLSKIAVAIYPKIGIPTGLSGNLLTHDRKVAEAYDKDPMVLKNATAGWYEASKKARASAFANAHKIKTPLHILIGDEDPIVSVEDVKKFFSKLPKDLKRSLHLLNGMYHEPFHEIEKEKAFQVVENILTA